MILFYNKFILQKFNIEIYIEIISDKRIQFNRIYTCSINGRSINGV